MKYPQIRRQIDKLKEATSGYFAVYRDSVIPVEALVKLANRFAQNLHCDAGVVRNSLQYLIDTPFTEKVSGILYWRLIANKDSLVAGNALPYYSRLDRSCQEEIQFEKVTPRANNFFVTFRVMTGHFAGGSLSQLFSLKALNRMLYLMGYNSRKYVIPNPISGTVGLFALAQLAPNPDRPIVDIIENTSIIQYNRSNIIQYRLKLKNCYDQCATPGRRCENCPKTPDQCKASMHYDR